MSLTSLTVRSHFVDVFIWAMGWNTDAETSAKQLNPIGVAVEPVQNWIRITHHFWGVVCWSRQIRCTCFHIAIFTSAGWIKADIMSLFQDRTMNIIINVIGIIEKCISYWNPPSSRSPTRISRHCSKCPKVAAVPENNPFGSFPDASSTEEIKYDTFWE